MHDQLSEMNKEEKKKFLAMDLAERLIRVEQNISASFGKSIPYNKTNFYLSMTPAQRAEFHEYLKRKVRKRVFFSLFSLIPLFFLSLINLTPTGNAVKSVLTESNTLVLEYVAAALILIFLVGGLGAFLSKLSFDKKFNHHLKVIDKFVMGKRIKKL